MGFCDFFFSKIKIVSILICEGQTINECTSPKALPVTSLELLSLLHNMYTVVSSPN